jgi:general secretion pathway protein A
MYERFFGLSDRPFEVTPDPKFLFLSSNHLEVMNTMLSGIRDRKGLIVVTGEVGTGKTILVHSVLERLEEGVKSAFIFHTTLTFEELLKAILVELEQPTPRRDEKNLWSNSFNTRNKSLPKKKPWPLSLMRLTSLMKA